MNQEELSDIQIAEILNEVEDSASGLKFRSYEDTGLISVSHEEVILDHESSDFIRGIGVTSRNSEEVKGFNKPLFDFIEENVYGNVVFLGNGFSTYPIELLERYPNKFKQIVLLDTFDYEAFYKEFLSLQAAFRKRDSELPDYLLVKFNALEKIVEAKKAGKIRFVRCLLGRDEFPDELKGEDFYIDIAGPSDSNSLSNVLEQGGSLVTTYTNLNFDPRFYLRVLNEDPPLTLTTLR